LHILLLHFTIVVAFVKGVKAIMEEKLVLTVDETAALLGISRPTAYQGVEKGKIPSIRVGKRILVPKAALEKLLAEAGARNNS
jgi:excisionase family DNA binding protein